MTKTEMLNLYEAHSAAHVYAIAYVVKHQVYFNLCNGLATELITLEAASRNQGNALRLRVRKAAREAMVSSAICLGADSQLMLDHYNKGEALEKLVTEYYGLEWKKDNVPFTKAGDIRVNGVEIQIKLDGATITNEKTLTRLIG